MKGRRVPLRIALVTPAPPASRAGNRNTALRWARLLRELGHRVQVLTQWPAAASRAGDVDLLLALHARRSHDSIMRFRERHPQRPVVLALTGTDIYRDLAQDAAARHSLRVADRLIVLQPCALDELRPRERAKAHVVLQSAPAAPAAEPLARSFELCVIGHLRWEKDPLCAARALAHLAPTGAAADRPLARLRITHAGRALDAQLEKQALAAMQADPRYRWLGEVAPARARRLIARAQAMIISSRLEGGANVVSEAIASGTPVLASRIPGNVGLLGADWPAYFPAEDDGALAELIRRFATEPAWRRSLRSAMRRLAWIAAPAQERASLAAALAGCAGTR